MGRVSDDPSPAPFAQDAPWWTRAVVYQIYPRSFADADGDGVGDLGGILTRLDHLADLGVDVLWLSPVYRSPMDDNGYDISDYEHVDPVFGTDAQLEAIIDGCHARGIKLVMDLVVNHTSDEHAWFRDSLAGGEKRDWYWWRPPRPGHVGGEPGAEPTNWMSFFAGSAWAFDEASGEYYLHLFSRRQPDLNWENPAVREAVYAMMNRWLDRGVDGFRMDVINLISKNVVPSEHGEPGLVDGEPLPGTPWGNGFDHVICGPRIHEFLHEMHERVFAGRDAPLLTVGEMPGVTPAQARLFTDPARREVDMVFQFEHVSLGHGPGGKYDAGPVDFVELKTNLARWQRALDPVGWNSLYWDNHDQPRAVSRFGDDSPEHREASAKALATILHLHRGTPYVYQGEEIGMTNYPFASIEQVHDIEARQNYEQAVGLGTDPERVMAAIRRVGRDNARTPMQWDASPEAGFTTGSPWLAVNPNHASINVAAHSGDPDSVLAHYRRLIDLRHRDETVALGRFDLLWADHPRLWAFTRRHRGDELLVLANCSSEPLAVDLDAAGGPAGGAAAWAHARLVLTNATRGGEPGPSSAPTELAPWEAVVLRRRAGAHA